MSPTRPSVRFPPCSCSAVSANYCPRVTCRDNKLFNCEVKDYKCTCPSCDKASDVTECRKTVSVQDSFSLEES